MMTMYALRISHKGRKPVVFRLNAEKEAREWVESMVKRGISAKYIGKVKVSHSKLEITNADPKKR